jgi:hypothetical protein
MEEQKGEMLVSTDLGLISKENANWLFTQRVLGRRGQILAIMVPGISQKLTYLYSYLRLLVEDIKSNAPTLPHGVSLDFNDCLTIARTGKLERPYTLEGEEFKYVVNHSVVEDLQRAGKEAFIKNQPKTNSKWDTNWED